MSRIPIVTLCGFLGSGKTTLLRRWRRDEALSDAALIVHDLSEFGLVKVNFEMPMYVVSGL